LFVCFFRASPARNERDKKVLFCFFSRKRQKNTKEKKRNEQKIVKLLDQRDPHGTTANAKRTTTMLSFSSFFSEGVFPRVLTCVSVSKKKDEQTQKSFKREN